MANRANHCLKKARDEAHMRQMQQRIRDHGVSCLGPVEHHFVRSVVTRRVGVRAPLVQNFWQVDDSLRLLGYAQDQVIVL